MNVKTSPYPFENKLLLYFQGEEKNNIEEKLISFILKKESDYFVFQNDYQSFNKIKEFFPEIKHDSILIPSNEYNKVKIEVFERKIILKTPKSEKDLIFIRTLEFSKWNSVYLHWEIPNYPGNLERIKNHFLGRITTFVEHKIESKICFSRGHNQEKIQKEKDEIILVKTNSNRIRIIFGFNFELTKQIKNIPLYSWDGKNKWWSIPYSEQFLFQLTKAITNFGLKFRLIEEEKNEEKIKRKTAFDVANYKQCPEDFLLKIQELRYSGSTYKTYKNALEDYLNFHHDKDVDKLNEKDIQSFLRHLVMERNVSTSYQNQAINAIKFYYERVLGGQRQTYFIDRPKKEKCLPVVMSEEEIVAIFKHCSNLKHKAILMVIYSAGLRISECINLKIKDIDSNRMQIRIEQSKGKKDRYTLLSIKTLTLLRIYFKEYKPKEYLFEGQFGGQYSTRSIQQFFQEIIKRAGISKKVTVHSLRHSFATHMLENGTNLRYIQSLLGHESSKTTEIYTHVTTKGFENLKSPIDNLDF